MVNKIARKEKWKSCIVGQIHDSMLLDVDLDELEHVKQTLKRVMTEDIRKYWKWIIVPLKVDGELGQINGNWYEKEKIKL